MKFQPPAIESRRDTNGVKMETSPLHKSAIDLSALRGILADDFDAPLVNRVIICLRTDCPGSARVELADVRPVLMENFP